MMFKKKKKEARNFLQDSILFCESFAITVLNRHAQTQHAMRNTLLRYCLDQALPGSSDNFFYYYCWKDKQSAKQKKKEPVPTAEKNEAGKKID